MPLELSVSDTTIWSITLESSITILEASFEDRNMLIVHATVVFESKDSATLGSW
jgi:hypothetical protein